MAGAAVHPRAAMPGIQGQQALQQAGAQPGHRGADRQLHRLQALAGAEGPRGRRGQALYLGGELRLECRAEPPLSPPCSGGPPPASRLTGRASQIASLTSAIFSVSAVNSW